MYGTLTDPTDLFYTFSDFTSLCNNNAHESVRYASQNGRIFVCTPRDVEVFIGVIYFMGLKKLPSIRDYWRTDNLGATFIREIMPRDRFEEMLKTFISLTTMISHLIMIKGGKLDLSLIILILCTKDVQRILASSL